MDLLKQCRQWFEQNEIQKVMDALEAIPAGERTPELDSELAKAYIGAAEIGEAGRVLYEKALELLAPHEEYFAGDHCWNYRIASAYYYLDEEGPALRYFEKALKARPGDKDTQEYIDDCRRRLSLPRFEKNFREKTQESWAAFTQIEGSLRQIMDTDKMHQRGEELIEKCSSALKPALRDTAFELGFNGEKYELILSPEGLRSRLFPLVYFQKQAPEAVLEHWNIWVGRQPCEGFELRAGEIEVRAEDVQMWAEETEDQRVSLILCCEKLTPLLKEDTDRVWWALSMLVDQTIGEVSAIAFVAGFDVYAQPKGEPAMLLSQLPELLQSMGLSLWRNGSDYLENSYLAYELEPVKDPEADWRLDVYTGTCRLPVLINDYLGARSDVVDEYHRDGIAAGFLCYPLAGFTGEERSKNILDFRDALQEAILNQAGAEAVTFLGGATGLYHGYLDFIAWDLSAVLTAAQAFFEGSDLPYAHFHAFRRDVGGVPLLDEKEPEPDIHEETGSLLSEEDIETLESFDEGVSGYFGKMLRWLEDFIKNGVEEGKFTEKQAHQDLQIALWYAFACNNLDDYIHYYQAAQWMKDSESNAAGCATWYYRYSVALMYCGRLEEALEYAERGIQEEPDYPWIWLQVGKLRAYFGDKVGALDAVKQGLELEPGDYEFLTLRQEIKSGATLEQMEYHWIDPGADQTLQQGLDKDADDKQRALACILVDEAGLAEFYELFCPERYGYEKNSPCCEFQYPVKEHLVELSFRMNEAGLSKMGTDWLRQLKERLDSGEWLNHTPEGEPEGILIAVFVDQTRRIGLVYQQPGDDQYFQLFLNPDLTKADAIWSSTGNREPEVYTEDEMAAIEQHIKNTFGEFENVFHELVSPDIHVDICVVSPSEERDYCTLVTIGMGAHRMNVPEELAEYKLERAELAIALPPDWKLDEESLKEERWYWPIGLLKVLARLPIAGDTWLGFGHTMDKQSPFAENTKLRAAILTGPQGVEKGGEVCTLPDGEEINFYQVIPLYQNEMEYKMEHDADALLKKMAGISFVVNPTRQSAITRGALCTDDFDGEMDDAARHLESVREKKLPVDEINAYNHMAIYLRWCMEHDLMSVEFMERYWEQVQPFMADLSRADLRGFIRDQLKGQLFGALFNKEGAAFAGYYYGEADSPYFPSDIDNYALEYFGSEQYYSDKFQDEAYLFIPFDENYYQAMAKVIEKRFVNWQGQDFDEDTLEPSELAEAMMEYLDCECTYFPSMTDDDPIMSAYNYAKRESVKEGFVPVLIKADDEILWECLIMNSDPDSDGEDDYAFDPDKVAEYRKKMLSAPIKNSKAVLEKMIGQRKEEAEDDDMDWDEDVLGEMEGGYDNRRFSSYWNSNNNMTYPLILAKIPVKNPWEIFAYLPFGNWNECPDTPELMAVAKYWFEKHGAIPAAMSHDELEFLLPAPISQDQAMELAVEQYGFCPDIVDQEDDPTVGALADVLRQSIVWYFWWD
ncbi:Suppressor of fused protein (SUFU) [Lachnoclostridium sp. An196]|uniref:suppressor of fused domain protein n=1 Tax=Lachnoclostridium sp. An196 TaxID=1965583 RepID=UPI000B38CE38|nr:suppressor of fused domain protein [Lachnoclostridium sp. An196]OUP17080.1 Suppressor of fused protein (SUFU) [Lachnoclostridium sp. An196]